MNKETKDQFVRVGTRLGNTVFRLPAILAVCDSIMRRGFTVFPTILMGAAILLLYQFGCREDYKLDKGSEKKDD